MVKVSDLYRPLLIFIPASGIFLGLSYLVFRDLLKAAIFSTLTIFLFFSYGHYYELLYPQRIPIIRVRFDHNFYKWFSLIALGLSFWRLKKLKASPDKLSSLLNIVALCLIVMPVYKIIISGGQEHKVDLKKQDSVLNQPKEGPNIFFIVADAYGRNDVLKDLYNFDNSKFLNALEKRGFYIAENSISKLRSDRFVTSINTNMTYLDSFAQEVGLESGKQMAAEGLHE